MQIINQRMAVVPIDSVQPHPQNPNRGDLGAIHASLDAHGFYGAIVAQESSGRVLAGNHRLMAMKQAGAQEIPVTFVDVDDEAALRILLVDNKTTRDGIADSNALAELLQELVATPTGLAGSGYDGDALDELLADLGQTQPELRGDPDAVPDAPEESVTRAGDLWLLGEHRLLCGDCTVASDVERALGGGAPRLLVTDPPYGVELDMEWRDRAGHNELAPASRSYMKLAMGGKGISGDTRADWSEAFALVPSLRVAYVWHADRHLVEVAEGLKRIGFELRQQIVWVKTVAAMSRSAYHSKHEPCWYAVRKGATAEWRGGYEQTTVWEAASPKHIMSGSREEKVDHPTQKPVELFAIAVRNHTACGDWVYDPFLGSGTALIAAEREGRRCVGLEIEPRYCDVICQRFKDLTGIEPIRQSPAREPAPAPPEASDHAREPAGAGRL